jgi:uncharacterized protein with NRDE domain
MCTVMLRFRPDEPWPLLLAAVRDEFLDRPWDPPAAHWPATPTIIGGRDRTAGGTWLAARPHSADPTAPPDPTATPNGPAVAALLNGVRLPPLELGARPSRGALPLTVLQGLSLPDTRDYDGFHLLLGTPSALTVWSWDGTTLLARELPPGDHIIVNLGVDTEEDPLVPHFAPLFEKLPDPPLIGPTAQAWGPWLDLLRGDGLAPDDPRALLVRKEFDGTEPGTEAFVGRVYGSGSASLVAIGRERVRYDFTPAPETPHWTTVLA